MKENEEKWVAFKWLDLKALSEAELKVMEEQWKPIPQLDGFCTEEKICCFKFNVYKPKYKSQIGYAKSLNEKHAYKKLCELSKVMRKYKYYLNPSKLYITKNGD